MAKIIVTFNGLVQQEVSINKSRITIGRRVGNDIVIDHLTVSGQHAAIDTTSNGSFVLDQFANGIGFIILRETELFSIRRQATRHVIKAPLQL